MDCVICNRNHTQFIRIEDGKPISVSPSRMQTFERSKAENICNALPRQLKMLGFKVENLEYELEKPKTPYHGNDCDDSITVELAIEDNVEEWAKKAKVCLNLMSEAVNRKPILDNELEMVEAEIQDVLHEIELLPFLNPCKAHKYYKRLKIARMKRRKIKDELAILDIIFSSNINVGKIENVVTFTKGMRNRIYGYRTHRTTLNDKVVSHD